MEGFGVVKLEGKMSLGKCSRRWKNTIKFDLKEWDGGVDWIYLARDNTVVGL
jgi:hypothetical protein